MSDISVVENTMQQSRWNHFDLSVLIFGAAFAAGMLLHWLAGDAAAAGWVFAKFGAVFGLLGAVYGAIYALNIRVDSANIDRHVQRTLVRAD